MAHINKQRRPWQPVHEPHARRAEGNQKFYQTSAWKRARKQQLMQQPLCAECDRNGIIKPGRVVDHITPINEGGERLSASNLQTLCDHCHNVKSATESHKPKP